MAYGAFKMLRRQGVARKMLVVAPLKPAYLVWPKEQEKWIDFAGLKVVVLHGKTRDEELIAGADICVINVDGLDWLSGATRVTSRAGRTAVSVDLARFKAFGFDTLVIDELTRFKHATSGRSKILRVLCPTFARRWGLTGSLVANGLLDLFGQYLVIDEGRSLGQYITHYRSKYFDRGYDGFSWNLRPGSDALIYERINPHTLRLAAEDYVDMPKVVEVERQVELPPAAMKVYRNLEDDMFAQLDTGDKLIIANAGSLTTKVRQVASGGVYLDPDMLAILGGAVRDKTRKWVNLHTEKVDALESLVEELQGAPLLVAYDFEHDLDRLRARFGKDVPYIGGGVSAKRSTELEAAWNRGEIPLLLGHPQSVAHGLNLQGSGARHVCWHTLTWDYELYDQFIRRIRRQGATVERIFVHHIVAKGTIDETMLWALRHKDRTQQGVYAALKAYRQK